jgi:hypothetical protein
MPLTTAPLVNVSRSPSTRRRGGSNPAPIVPGVDSTPNAFTFTDVTGATTSTVYESNTITVAGIDTASGLSIVGGEYSLNGGAYAITPATVQAGDTVKVRATSSGSGSTAVNVTLTIGGVSDTYTVTTGVAADTTPDAFTFTDVTSAAVSTVYVSNTITVGGINAPANLTISGGEYSINGGAYASSNTTVSNGDTVKVRGTSSGSNSTAVNVSLTIGGVSDVYSITTAVASSDFSFTPLAYYDGASVVQAAGAVSQWTDKGPNGIHLIQAVGANQPAWASNTITFDGVSDYLISADVDLSAKTALCLYAKVTTKTGIAQHSGVVIIASPDGDYQGRGALIWSSQPVNLLQTYRDGVILNTTVVPDIPIRLGVELDLSGAVDTVYDFDTPTSNTAALTNNAFGSAVRFLMGARLTGIATNPPAYFANCSVSKLVVIDFVPTVAQRDEIKAWLGPALWTPAALGTDVVGWYDAQDATTITQAASAVSQWTDKSTASDKIGNATQATGAQQPAYQATGLGGSPAVYFAGNQSMTLADLSSRSWTAAEVFYIRKLDADPPVIAQEGAPLFSTRAGAAPASNEPYSDGNIYLGTFVGGGYARQDSVGNPTQSLAVPRIIQVRSAPNDFQYWIDGAQFYTTASNTFGLPTETRIGVSAGSYLFKGHGGEIIICKRVLTTLERQKVEGYLAHKWGLTANLPAGHPYKSAPPTTATPPWTPAALGANLVSWHDASDAATVTQAAGAVSQLSDKSGNGRHMVQATGSLQGAYTAAAQNGLNALTLVDDWMEASVAAGTFTGGLCFASAWRVTGTSVTSFNCTPTNRTSGGVAGPVAGFNIGRSIGTGAAESFLNTYPHLGSDPLFTAWNVFVQNVTFGTPGSYGDWINGTAQPTFTGNCSDAATTLSMATRADRGIGAKAIIGETVATKLLAEGDRLKLEGYLAHKWGLAGNLPAGHPYKSSPP